MVVSKGACCNGVSGNEDDGDNDGNDDDDSNGAEDGAPEGDRCEV